MKRSIIRSLFTSSVALFTYLGTASAALAIDEFAVPTPGAKPAGITAAPDGSVWFTEEATTANKIGRVFGGSVAEFGGLFPAPPPTTSNPETGPAEIAVAPDNAVWFTEHGANRVGRMAPSGGPPTLECTLPAGSAPDGITKGPDNRMWFTLSGTNRIGALDPLAANPCTTIAQYPPTSSSTPLNNPGDITTGPDGALWFTQSGGNKIGRIPTSGSPITQPTDANDPSGITSAGATLWFTEFAGDRVVQISTAGVVTNAVQLAPGTRPSGITLGADNALWFTETDANRIGRISVAGALTNEFTIPTPGSAPGDITAGSDAVWFTEFLGNKIGRIATSTGGGGGGGSTPPPSPPPPVTSTKKKCKVPRLRGLTVKKARRKLKKAKCKYKIRGKGRVRSTVPKAGRTTTKRVTVKCKRKKAKRTGRRAAAGAVR